MKFMKFISPIIFITISFFSAQIKLSGEGFTVKDYEIGAETIQYQFQPIPLEALAAGSGIPEQYNRQRRSPTQLTCPEVFAYAKSSFDKPDDECSPRELLSRTIITDGINAMAKILARHLIRSPLDCVDLIVFGGTAHGAGPLYLNLLESSLNKELKDGKTVKVTESPLGDERALIGTAGIALQNQPMPTQPYILGIDLGGTHMRAGLVTTQPPIQAREIISEPTFANEYEHTAMNQLRITLQQTSRRYPNLVGIPDHIKIHHFLPNKLDREMHTKLKKSLIDRLCALINRFNLDELECISIASPGLNGQHGYIKLAYNVPLTCVNLTRELRTRLRTSLPIYITGDVASAGVGEFLAGAGQGLKQFFILDVGTGINLCLVEQT